GVAPLPPKYTKRSLSALDIPFITYHRIPWSSLEAFTLEMLQIKFSLNANHYREQGSFDFLPGENLEKEILDAVRISCKLQSMLPIETVISLYEQIRANIDCLIDYKVKHNSSRQFFLSAIDSSPNQGRLTVLLDSHLPDGLNINSPSNSDVTSYDSAIDLNDNH
ncbi:hypothetical protein N7449_004245, partial [Penicillium cf. viridicatum]